MSAQCDESQWRRHHIYDAAGNRTKQGGTYARSTIPPALSVVSYNANNQQLTFAANTLTYDLNGNVALSESHKP